MKVSIGGKGMKESTFCTVMMVLLLAASFLDGDSIRSIIATGMAFGFMFTGTVCRAIERNGKEG